MWFPRNYRVGGFGIFFRIGLGHTNLATYYKDLWALSYKHKIPISDIYDMMPYEKDLYMELIAEDIEKNLE